MIQLTRAQEREERQKMGRGMRTSIFGLIFCWVPLAGLILAAAGFMRVFVRITTLYRARRRAYLAAALLILLLVTGVQMGGVYLYIDNPGVLSEAGMWVFTKLTGQTELPGGYSADYYGVDYGTGGGLGYDPSLWDNQGGDEGGQWYESEDGEHEAFWSAGLRGALEGMLAEAEDDRQKV